MLSQEMISCIKKLVIEFVSPKLTEFQTKIDDLNKEHDKLKTVLKQLVRAIDNDTGNNRESSRLESTPNKLTGANFGGAQGTKPDNLKETFLDLTFDKDGRQKDTLTEAIWSDDDDDNDAAADVNTICQSSNSGQQQHPLKKNSHVLSPASQLSKRPVDSQQIQTKSRFPVSNDFVSESPNSLDDAMETDNMRRKETEVQTQNYNEALKQTVFPERQSTHQELVYKKENEHKSIEADIASDNAKSLENEIERDQENENSGKDVETRDIKSSAEEKHQTSADVAARGDSPEEKTKTEEFSQHKQTSKSKLAKIFGSKGTGKSKGDKS